MADLWAQSFADNKKNLPSKYNEISAIAQATKDLKIITESGNPHSKFKIDTDGVIEDDFEL